MKNIKHDRVKNLVCMVGDEAEVSCHIAKIESTRLRQISDSLLIRWSQNK